MLCLLTVSLHTLMLSRASSSHQLPTSTWWSRDVEVQVARMQEKYPRLPWERDV